MGVDLLARIWRHLTRFLMKTSVEIPNYERIERTCGRLYVGHYKDKAIATYEVDELYAFFLDNGVPPEFTIYDELDLLFTQ